jgi:NAD(P)-dependent dehydrogenase (short-subunit alcohol dehydrogenase family)
MTEFTGKVAVITGGSSGIGRAIANRCASEGMKVVIAGMNEEALKRTEAELRERTEGVLALKTDVSKLEEVEKLAQGVIKAFGGVHLLFNNAGVGAPNAPIWESAIEDWQWVLDVNLWGVIHGIGVFLPLMISQNSECHIVNTGSMAGLNAGPGLGVYKVSKYAVVTLTETLYYELTVRKSKVNVSLLCPGWVKTNIMTSDRNRPFAKPAKFYSPNSYDLEIEKIVSEGVASGMDPANVATKVFDAIRLGKFYILTHPEAKPQIQARMEDILSESNPRPLGGA